MTGPPLLDGVEKSRKTQQKGKTKTTERSDQNTLAASRPEKGSQKSTRRIPKTRGAQNGTPRKTPRSRTHGQNGRANKCGGTKKGTRKSNTSACGGVPCDYLSFLSLKKKKPKKGDDVGDKTKGREKKRPETPDLTSREFFQDIFGSERPKIKQKHRQNSTKKHTTNTRKFFQTTPDQTPKTQNEKNGQHFPLREGGKTANRLTPTP